MKKIALLIGRIFDVVLATIALIVFSIPMLLVALIIWVVMGSPILFCQQRPGLHGKIFMLYKFRTMSETKNAHGELLQDGARLTRLGYWLRRLSLDELPQLLNVLKGDMRFVGPRPLLPEYLPLYTAEQARRHNVKPGITGWAQVNGRNAIAWSDKFKLDVWYVDHASFWLDIKIIYLTVCKVLRSKGISQQGHVTAEKFEGGV